MNLSEDEFKLVYSQVSEADRNKLFFILLHKLLEQKDYATITLMRTMVEKDTLSMQKTFEIMIKKDSEL